MRYPASRTTRRTLAAAGVAAVLVGAAGVMVAGGQPGAAAAQPRGDGRLVLVSGRDDHGEVALPRVPLLRSVQGSAAAGSVADGTLARVVATDGQWQEVESLDGVPVRGWVDDFHLRGVVHLVGPAPSCVPRLDGRPLPPGQQAVVSAVRADGEVGVTTLGSRPRTGWVPRAQVRELPPQGPGCGDGTRPRTDGPRH